MFVSYVGLYRALCCVSRRRLEEFVSAGLCVVCCVLCVVCCVLCVVCCVLCVVCGVWCVVCLFLIDFSEHMRLLRIAYAVFCLKKIDNSSKMSV